MMNELTRAQLRGLADNQPLFDAVKSYIKGKFDAPLFPNGIPQGTDNMLLGEIIKQYNNLTEELQKSLKVVIFQA